ncbi:MAG TPA: hypothetical protein VFP84_23350 [Kofleriaceae bacterium]|nr:hypothetical protein [Kofleriaceae bacterium]
MRAPVLVLGFIFAWVAALAGCGGDDGGGGTNKPLGNAKEITAFRFAAASNPGLAADVDATINAGAITATVPAGTNVTALVATFTTTGASVTVGGAAQVSGTTANDFSQAKTYTVTAEDSTVRNYTVTVTVAASNAKAITAFAFTQAANPALAGDVTATINGNAIAATVPFGTDVTALVATFTTTGASVAVGGAAQTSGTTANDFTNPVTYTVTAADGSTQGFTVTVTVAASTAKAITAFAFASANNPGLAADVAAVINGANITATVPFGTDVTALVATFSTTGASVAVGATPQVSAITANNFTNPVTYTVTAADGSTQAFTVTVTIAPSAAKALTAFAFTSVTNPGLPADVVATIDQAAHTIGATVPFGTDVTALVATFTTTGASVAVGGATQTSGTTANDFTNPVTYTVTAGDGSTQAYVVTVTVALNTAKAITAFSFDSANNPGLTTTVTATVDEGNKTISATVPFGTDVHALVATFTSTGASVAVGATPQVSGQTANDFTAPVEYVVTAGDGSTATYTVTVTIFAANTKDITAYAFTAARNPTLTGDAVVTINGTDISAVVPFGTSAATIQALVADFTTTGNTVTVAGAPQVSGTTSNDFTNPVAYLVTAQDGSSQTFTVTVTVAKNPAKDITAFQILLSKNAGIKIDGNTVIDTVNNRITVELTAGVAVDALVATFTTTGVAVQVGGTDQVSGTTANDFTNPVTYTVTAADGTTKDYVVTIKRFVTSFTFTGARGNELTFPADGSSAGLANPVIIARKNITGATAASAFSGSQWPTAAALNPADRYYTITVTPSTTMTLTQLALRDQRSGTGPTMFSVRSSLDNFATDIGGAQATHVDITNNARTVLTLPATFANLTNAVELRFYGFAAGAAGGTWRVDDIQLSGNAP